MEDREGDSLRAFSLIADGLPDDVDPSVRYVALIREGARQHGLPAHWTARLDKVRHTDGSS